jgi:cytochrome c-type biogenesis protein
VEPIYVSLGAAFIAGIFTFISPCLLPLIPIYIGYFGGTTAIHDAPDKRRITMVHAVLFVIGFSAVFIVLGASVGLIGDLLNEYKDILSKIGGVLVIVLGLQMAGVISIPLLSREKRFELGAKASPGYLTSALLGTVFAFAWTPCVGPILLAILALASASETAWQGASLLAVYSAGLGLPFLITALALGTVGNSLRRINRHLHIVSVVSGAFLIIMGVLLVTDQLQQLAGFFTYDLPL